MPDREKVIKGLEVCTSIADGESCPKDCPYYQEVCYGYEQLMRDAIAMLKEQEAVEPGIAQDVDGIFATCGNCKKKLWKMMGLEFVVNPDEMPRFCPQCGKKVKWE